MKTSKMFSNWSEVTGRERNEIVFERLNKMYGAYEIRTNYNTTLLKAFLGSGLLVLLISISLLFSASPGKIIIHFPATNDTTSIYIPKPPGPDDPPKPQNRPVHSNASGIFKPVDKDDSVPKKDTIQFLASNTMISADKSDDSTGTNTGTPVSTGGKNKINFPIDTVVNIAEVQPEFPGGDEELFRFLKNHTHIPESIIEIGRVSEKVGIVFIINKDGSITGTSLLHGGSKLTPLNNEALRVVNQMPKWKPGMQNGNAVMVRMILPIRFEVK